MEEEKMQAQQEPTAFLGLGMGRLTRKPDVEMAVHVPQYEEGLNWHFSGRISLRFIQSNLSHPPAVAIWDGDKLVSRVPLEELATAIAWMYNAATR